MSSSNVCGADRYDLPGPTWRRLTCDLPAGHDGKHHNELFDWPRDDEKVRA